MLWELIVHDEKWASILQVPESHMKGVICIAGFMFSKNEALVASTSSDGKTNIWDMVLSSAMEGGCSMSLTDSISVGARSMVALSMAQLSATAEQVLLATGGLENKVHLYYGSILGKFIHGELKYRTYWVRSLDFSLPISIDGRGESLLLASSSRDKGIRIWKISSHYCPPDTNGELSLAPYIEGPILVSGPSSYQVLMESLLLGHEDWTYSVQWQLSVPSSVGDISYHQPLSLLSSSMDKTMRLWQPERTTCTWMNVVTVDELIHCALEFYGGHWSSDRIFHKWENVGCEYDDWQLQKVLAGHFVAASDISWARSGDYILSVSNERTTRVFAPWKGSSESSPWHETPRPQVHGNDIHCVSNIRGNGKHPFVSGANEKVSRVFNAPLSFSKFILNGIIIQNALEAQNEVLASFYHKWQHEYLVVNKWFALPPMSDIYEKPNKVYSLFGLYCGSYMNFHANEQAQSTKKEVYEGKYDVTVREANTIQECFNKESQHRKYTLRAEFSNKVADTDDEVKENDEIKELSKIVKIVIGDVLSVTGAKSRGKNQFRRFSMKWLGKPSTENTCIAKEEFKSIDPET